MIFQKGERLIGGSFKFCIKILLKFVVIYVWGRLKVDKLRLKELKRDLVVVYFKKDSNWNQC